MRNHKTRLLSSVAARIIHFFDFDKTLLDTACFQAFSRDLLAQQALADYIRHNPGYQPNNEYVDLNKYGGSFTVYLQKKYGFGEDYAVRTLERRLPKLTAFAREKIDPGQHMHLVHLLRYLLSLGHTVVIVTHNQRAWVRVALRQMGITDDMIPDDRIVDLEELSFKPKTTMLALQYVMKKFGNDWDEVHWYDDELDNLIWPYMARHTCRAVLPVRPEPGSHYIYDFHHKDVVDSIVAWAA